MKFAVVDVETSGFGKTDRILEIGVVLLENSEIVDEFETIINPLRNVNNADIHGLNATSLSLAPTFDEIKNELSKLLDGRILVAHNLPFDQRMLKQEFIRFTDDFDFGSGICTLKLTGMKLNQAALKFGINLVNAHSAIDDARATAKILKNLDLDLDKYQYSHFQYLEKKEKTRILQRSSRDRISLAKVDLIHRFNDSISISDLEERKLYYFDELSRALADLVLSTDEQENLKYLTNELGLSSEEQQHVHQIFLEQLIKAAMRDGFISEYEKNIIDNISRVLEISNKIEVMASDEKLPTIQSGLRVCFTGAAKDSEGVDLTRDFMHEVAISKGFIPVDSVSKKNCDLLVSADVNSMSGKTKKARNYGIPVMSVIDFISR
jgi:DNA polymerase-3 subunit epsilon